MSTDEEMAIIGRMVIERKQIEQRGTALQDELRRLAKGLEELAFALEMSDSFTEAEFLHLTLDKSTC